MKLRRSTLARKVVAAGLGLAMATGAVTPTVALADTGNTNLYVQFTGSGFTAPEGSANENMRVTIPVAISYVVDADGNLTGPSDGTVKIRNNSSVSRVHISGINTEAASGFELKESVGDLEKDGDIFISMSREYTDTISLGRPMTESDLTTNGRWVINAGEEINLNQHTGKAYSLAGIREQTKQKIATIHWSVAPGYTSASVNDNLFTIHFVNPTNDIPDKTYTKGALNKPSFPDGYSWRASDGRLVRSWTEAELLFGDLSELTLYGTPTE